MSAQTPVAGPARPDAAQRIPIAPAQRGIYFMHTLAADISLYNVPVALRVRGPLDPVALQGAVDALARRHQALRTTFEDVGGEPVQVIHPAAEAPAVTVHWPDLPPRGLAAASAEAGRAASAPFDLRDGPLWRVDVVAVGPDEHAVMFAFHHIIIDEVSATVLARDFRAAYADPQSLAPVPPGHEYADFCLSQQDDPDEDGLAYWRAQLGGQTPRLLPTEVAAVDDEAFHGERIRFTVDGDTTEQLTALCVKLRASAFMVFHAVLAMLLHGWSGEENLAFGTPMGGRVDERFTETVGFFQNTVVLRAEVTDEDTFAGLLKRSRRTVLEAVQYQHTPFEAVVAAVRPQRDATRNPLFQAALVYNRSKVEQDWTLDGMQIDPLPFDWPMSHFDLTLSLTNEAQVLAGEFAYDTNRFARETVEELAAAFRLILAAVCADPQLAVAQAPRPARLLQASAAPAAPVAEVAREPRNPREEILCGLFEEVLGIPDIDIDDDFFDLGGNSLIAGRLISRARSVLAADVSLRDLFEAPTVAGLAGRLQQASGGSALVRQPRPERIPLSYAQRGLWYLHRLEGPSPTYNVPLVLRFASGVDREALRAALRDVVTRHESLRTVFHEADGEGYQVVLEPGDAAPALEVVDIPEAELDQRLGEAARHTFDLATHAPIRAWLFALPTGEDVLLILLHHITSDGWSLGPLGRDLARAYEARRTRTPLQWAELPVQYPDFTLWQRDRLGAAADPGSLAAAQTAFWRAELADLPMSLDLPTDRPRPPIASYRGATVDVDWPADLHRAVADLARQSGATMFMVLQAALATLLGRLGAGTDIPIGAPSAGRGDEALDDLVGYFINTLVLRTRLDGDPTFGELVERVRQRDLAAFGHQDLPFDQVVEAVNPLRSLAAHPLFQVMLTFQRNVIADLRLTGIETRLGQTHTGVSKFDLSFNLQEFFAPDGSHAGIQGVVEFADDLYDAATVSTLLDRLVRLLWQVTESPKRRISEIDVLDPVEREHLLVDWNRTEHEVPQTTLPQRFAEQCARTPDATAVVCGSDEITYAELDAAANRLARVLIERGVGPERFVAVAVPRSIDLVVALLGTLKAGGAYVPIDLDQPTERTAFILDDVDPVLTVTTTETLAEIGALRDRAVIRLDADMPPEADAQPPEGMPATMDNAAYAIFTSGSTGRPKGVVVEHRSLGLYLAFAAHEYPGVAGRSLVHSPVSFDLTVTGLFAPLCVGGSVELAALDAETTTVPAIAPSFLKITPSHLPLLATLPDTFSPTGQLVIGGEALSGDALAAWRVTHPQTTVINEYGPTETTVGCTRFALGPGDPDPTGPVPIGRPFWNTRVYVLDAALAPVPVGVTGELYIAGDLLARGYLNRPELTAQRFLDDPFAPPGGRMYRTGDLARWNRHGELEYLGRNDDQVKIRGFRIELGEIESVLAEHDAVAAVAVAAREDVPGDRRLVAYIVPTATPVAETELRAYLADRLPRYMQPSAFVLLDALPLSANGKLARAALPAPTTGDRPAGRRPGTSTERDLHPLFAELLGAGEVSVDDSFFDLGGHSLLAVRLVARISQELHRTVAVGDLIGSPTIAALAARLDATARDQVDLADVVRLRPGTGTRTVALIHPVGGTLLCYDRLVRALPGDVAVVGCERIAGTHPVEESLADLADRHAAAIARAVPDGELTVVGWSVGGVVAHAVAGRLLARGRSVAGIGLLDSLAVRTSEGHAAVTASGARLRDLAQDLDGLLDPDSEDLLRQYGMDPAFVAAAPAAEVAAMLTDWAHLIELVARHEPAPIEVAADLFVCADNPGDLPRIIEASWAGLCAELRVHPVPGRHLTILTPPAVDVVADALGNRRLR